jgi:hypothetical protein
MRSPPFPCCPAAEAPRSERCAGHRVSGQALTICAGSGCPEGTASPVRSSTLPASRAPPPSRAPRTAAAGPQGLTAEAEGLLQISLAAGLGLGVPSNYGMQLSTGRPCSVHLSVCSLRFAATPSMVASLPLAADP